LRDHAGVPAMDDAPILPFAAREAWAAWLDEHHATEDAVWLKFAKKASGVPTVTYDEALEVALCYGWIDGIVRRFDDDFYVQRWTPRRKRSKWSQINRDKAVALIERGEMKPAGLAEVERAKADGRWEAAYGSPRTIEVPDDLRTALEAEPGAAEAFEALTRSTRYSALYAVHDAKRPETRARRIAALVASLTRPPGS
jgi:uncharacterized protein YdeI (YjbR/CyaY-like superfamily)